MSIHLRGVHTLVAHIVTVAKEHSFRRRGQRTTGNRQGHHEESILHGQTAENTFDKYGDDDDSVCLLDKSAANTSPASTLLGSLPLPTKDNNNNDESHSSDTTLSSSWSSLTPSEELCIEEKPQKKKTKKNKKKNKKNASSNTKSSKEKRRFRKASSSSKPNGHLSGADRRAMRVLTMAFVQKYGTLIDENDEKALVGRAMLQKLYTWHGRRVQQVLQCPANGGQLAEMARHILAYKLGHVCTAILKLMDDNNMVEMVEELVDGMKEFMEMTLTDDVPPHARRASPRDWSLLVEAWTEAMEDVYAEIWTLELIDAWSRFTCRLLRLIYIAEWGNPQQGDIPHSVGEESEIQ